MSDYTLSLVIYGDGLDQNTDLTGRLLFIRRLAVQEPCCM